MGNDDVLFEIQRSLGRIEARLDGQDQALADLKTDVATLKATPGRRWSAVGKWASSIAAAVIGAVLAFKLKVIGR